MSGRPSLSDLPLRYQAQIIANQKPNQTAVPLAPEMTAAPLKQRLRQSQKPVLNRLETAFLEKLKVDLPQSTIYAQAIRLELARGIWYKPDFFVPFVSGPGGPMAFEVKGPRAFRGGFENLKVAARSHPWIIFTLVWRADGNWCEQRILP